MLPSEYNIKSEERSCTMIMVFLIRSILPDTGYARILASYLVYLVPRPSLAAFFTAVEKRAFSSAARGRPGYEAEQSGCQFTKDVR